MSWNSGSQLAMRLGRSWPSGVWPKDLSICHWFQAMLLWVTITPFGESVEPEVYWRKATVSDARELAFQGLAAASRHSSVVRKGILIRSHGNVSETVERVRSTVGRQSAMIALTRSAFRLRRGG